MKIDKKRLYTVAAITLALAVMIPLIIACLWVIRSARAVRPEVKQTRENAESKPVVVNEDWRRETVPSLGISLDLPPSWSFTVERLGPMFPNQEGVWGSENGHDYWTISEGRASLTGKVDGETSYKIGTTVYIDSTQWPDEEVKAGPTSCDDPSKPPYLKYKNQYGVTVTLPCLHGEDDPYAEGLFAHGGFGLSLGGRHFSTCMNIWSMTEAGVQHALADLKKTLDSVSLDAKVANKANSDLALRTRPSWPYVNDYNFVHVKRNGISISFPPNWKTEFNDDKLPTNEDLILNYERGAEEALQWMNPDIHLEIVTWKENSKGAKQAVKDFFYGEETSPVKTAHMEGIGYKRELSCSDDLDAESACQFGQRLALTSNGKLFLVWVGFREPTMDRLIQRVARWEKMLDTLEPDIKNGQ
jgi:hypothetical protein